DEKLKVLLQQGYARILTGGEVIRLDEIEDRTFKAKDVFLVLDRIVVQDDESFYNRLADAVQTAFYEGQGVCILKSNDSEKEYLFSSSFELDALTFLEPNVHLFSFNNPYGACPVCEGYGNV